MKPTVTGSKLFITLAAMSGALMALLDISIVNVALSDIRASFGTPLDQIAWVSTGYMMANVVVIPMTGWLQARFGFKRYFTASVLLFVVASTLCALAWNLPSLVFFRVLQGIGGGAIIPTSQAILFAAYPGPQRNMAGALFGLGAVMGPLLGPTVGGYLIEIGSWHWIFLINVPIGLTSAWLAWKHVNQPDFVPARDPIDVTGIALLVAGMGSLQWVLEEGNREGWLDSTKVCVFAAVAFVSLATFVVHELETPHPVVDLRVFLNLPYAAATGLNFLVGTVLFGATFMFSLYAGAVMHYTALQIGLLFLQCNWIQILIMPLLGRFGNRIDGRLLVSVGVLLMMLSMSYNVALDQTADPAAMQRPLYLRALALSAMMMPLSVMALSTLRPSQMGTGAGLFNLTRELGGSIGTAWMSTMIDRGTHVHGTALAAHVNVYESVTQDAMTSLERGVVAATSDPHAAAVAVLANRVRGQALILAFSDNYATLIAVFALSFLLVGLLQRQRTGVDASAAH